MTRKPNGAVKPDGGKLTCENCKAPAYALYNEPQPNGDALWLCDACIRRIDAAKAKGKGSKHA